MPWTDHTGPVPSRSEAELLALTRAKAHAAAERAGRRLRALSAMAAVVLLVGLGAVVERRGDGAATQLRTTAGDVAQPPFTPETTTGIPATTIPTTTPSVPRPTSTTTRPASAPTSRPAATTSSTASSQTCRNSSEPSCGPFRWDPPKPPDQPITAKLSHLPIAPKAGATVTFSVTVDDPDGRMLVDPSGRANNYGDGPPGVGGNLIGDCEARFGPWTPGAPVPVHADLTFEHVYAAPGTYTVSFPIKSLGDCTYGPSETTATATITVAP